MSMLALVPRKQRPSSQGIWSREKVWGAVKWSRKLGEATERCMMVVATAVETGCSVHRTSWGVTRNALQDHLRGGGEKGGSIHSTYGFLFHPARPWTPCTSEFLQRLSPPPPPLPPHTHIQCSISRAALVQEARGLRWSVVRVHLHRVGSTAATGIRSADAKRIWWGKSHLVFRIFRVLSKNHEVIKVPSQTEMGTQFNILCSASFKIIPFKSLFLSASYTTHSCVCAGMVCVCLSHFFTFPRWPWCFLCAGHKVESNLALKFLKGRLFERYFLNEKLCWYPF